MALGIPMALVLGSAISAGGGILGGLLGKNKEYDPLAYKQLPDYPEATGAREDWWNTLQDWEASGDYGATDMNWDEIFKSAQDKLSRYYWGGVNDPGVAGKIKASAARRNMPVNDAALASLGFQESIDLSDLITELNTQKAQYGESARNTWLISLMNLARQKPSFVTGTGTVGGSTTYGVGNMIGDVTSGIGSIFMQYAKQKQMEDMSGGVGGTMPSTAQPSLTSDFNLGNLSSYFNQNYSGYK